jgi:putative endonuclease
MKSPSPQRRAPNGCKPLGATGETIVRAHLEQLGWRVLATNYRCRAGEMDLIAEEPALEGAILVFIEVKTRRGATRGAPAEAVDSRKRRKLVAVAQAYLAERNAGGAEPAMRFDVAEVWLGPDGLARVALQRAGFVVGE